MRPRARQALADRRVLMAEDELLVRIAFAEDLRAAGVTVVETGNADEAWGYLQAGGPADLVFSDICMPGSIDGLELARRIKQHYPYLSVILTSGSCGPGKTEGIQFLPKPYDFGRAIQVILDILSLKRDAAYDIARHG